MADGLQNADGISNNKKRLLFSKSPLPSTDCEALLNARREGEGFRHRNHESPIEWCPEWHIVGSCNGLICLYDTDANSNGHHDAVTQSETLVSPATGVFDHQTFI
ncbi:hypothetical protein C1H46_023936 [Malus baccata]|uniref:Uncharacterized protein n=1 Tax=Malus baccata TaxID=106549 RepID=A0A540LVS9_MALBA|nr:hypothetical protein C1H46_023936 [Malus baccata]